MRHASSRCLQCGNPRHYLHPLPILHLHSPLLESQLENRYWGQLTPNWLEWGWSRLTGNCICWGRRSSAGPQPEQIWKPHMNYRCREFEVLKQRVTEWVSRCWKKKQDLLFSTPIVELEQISYLDRDSDICMSSFSRRLTSSCFLPPLFSFRNLQRSFRSVSLNDALSHISTVNNWHDSRKTY